MARMSIKFDGFDDLAAEIDRAGGNLEAAVEDALLQTQEYIQNGLTIAAAPYNGKGIKGYATGKMFRSIIDDRKIYIRGNVAEVRVGFELDTGFHSIFIMYGTPRIKKDQRVYNAIRGTKTQKDIAELQESVLRKHLALGGENG